MNERYEIIPGTSIGPFRLGMRRDEIAALNVRPMEPHHDHLGAEYADVGVNLRYDESGRCRHLEARVMGSGTATFLLAGRVVNGVSAREADEILHSLSPDVTYSYGCIDLDPMGISAVRWERTDDDIYCFMVDPPRPLESAGT
jgi:hypothetical protein